jgi:hypothetical protein
MSTNKSTEKNERFRIASGNFLGYTDRRIKGREKSSTPSGM